MDLKKIFETGNPHFKKLVMINHRFVVFIQHDPGELRGISSWALAKFRFTTASRNCPRSSTGFATAKTAGWLRSKAALLQPG
jgi:hypothetical protein